MYVCMIIYIYMSVLVLLIWLLDISEKKKRKKCVLYCMQTDWNISGSTCDCVSSLFWNQRIVTNHTCTTLPRHIKHQTQQQQTQLIEFGLKRVKNRFQAANLQRYKKCVISVFGLTYILTTLMVWLICD